MFESAPRSRLQESPSICLLQEVDHVAENSDRVKREWAGTAPQLLRNVTAKPRLVACGVERSLGFTTWKWLTVKMQRTKIVKLIDEKRICLFHSVF